MNAKSQPQGLAFLFSGNALKVHFDNQTREIKKPMRSSGFCIIKTGKERSA